MVRCQQVLTPENMTKWLFTFVAVLGSVGASAAQQSAAPALQESFADTVGLSGQTWITMGNLSPIEHNNGYVQSYVEQSATVWATDSESISVTPYFSLGTVLDTKGYPWNNKVEPRAGIKINRFFRNGVVSAGVAYSYENRFNGMTSSGPTLYVQDWFGWQSAFQRASRFPGSSWVAVGNLSPVERGNIMGQGYLSQGFVAKRFSGFLLVPYGESTVYRDSHGFDWDNKATYGGGMKAIIPHSELYTEIGAAYLRENRFNSGNSASGLTVFMNCSFQWNLLGRKAGR
jgi:hypothetical protein